MEVTITKSLLSAINVREPDLDRFVRRILAVELYREGRLSLGKAAEVAGANKWEMIMLLDEKGVPVDYSGEDAKADLETSGASGMMSQKNCSLCKGALHEGKAEFLVRVHNEVIASRGCPGIRV